jgi:hypothetical protein
MTRITITAAVALAVCGSIAAAPQADAPAHEAARATAWERELRAVDGRFEDTFEGYAAHNYRIE